jgi:hypothetical protein
MDFLRANGIKVFAIEAHLQEVLVHGQWIAVSQFLEMNMNDKSTGK